MASTQQSDDPWGDDDDDAIFLEASQMLEQEEERKWMTQLLPQEAGTYTRAILSPTQAAAAFNMRRAHLQETHNSNQSDFPGDTDDESRASIKHLFSQLQTEKEKNVEISSKHQALQGEADNLRRQLDKQKKSQQAELFNSIKKEKEEKQKFEEERRSLVRERTALQTELRGARDEIIKLRQKVVIGNSPRLSVGGASPQRPQPVPVPRPPNTLRMSFKSDPNLQSPNAERRPTPLHQQQQRIAPVVKVNTTDAYVEVDESWRKLELQDDLIFSSVKERNVINFHHLDSIDSLQLKSVRRRIFSALGSLIRMDFMEAKPILEKVAKTTPTEIMASFVPGNRFKVCFPDLKNSMYLCGVLAQRKRENEEKGEYIEVTYPILPSIKNPAIIDLDRLQNGIAIQLESGGVWAALRDIKRNLKTLLQELSGEKRFRLYEIGNLSGLWHLLAWAKHLWGLILMEEELEFVVESFGKAEWIRELKEWSGLVLKIDWRDYFAPEIESIIRRLSLSILESVITLGYFEESQKRYEILYSVIKDTLLKTHLRTEVTLRQCLVIITWTVADKNILNYLCLDKKDRNCLARLLGETVLLFFKQTENHNASVNVLVHYLNLLENLMLKQPYYLYSSKVSRPDVNAARQKLAKRLLLEHNTDDEVCSSSSDSEDEEEEHKVPESELEEEEAMDVDSICSQYADPDRYKFEEGCQERARKFNNVGNVKCWINPKEWEAPMGYTGEKECQCRKVMLGSAFIMLYSVTKFWGKAYLSHEEEVEASQERERVEIRLRMETEMNDEILRKLQKKASTWRQFILEFLSKTREKATADDDGEQDDNAEWTWDELLKYQQQTRENETEEDPDWMWGRRRAENIFDYVIRQGAKLMGFCSEKSVNLALAVGSEGCSCFMFLESFFKFYAQNAHVTAVEKRIVLESTREDEEQNEGGLSKGDVFAIDEEYEHLDYDFEKNLIFDPVKILAGLPKSEELPPFSEEEFEESFRYFEQERIEKM